MSLCKAIYHYDDDDDAARRSAAKNSGLPFAKAHTQTYTTVYNENPPFLPGFYIMKMLFNETFPTNVVSLTPHPSNTYITAAGKTIWLNIIN